MQCDRDHIKTKHRSQGIGEKGLAKQPALDFLLPQSLALLSPISPIAQELMLYTPIYPQPGKATYQPLEALQSLFCGHDDHNDRDDPQTTMKPVNLLNIGDEPCLICRLAMPDEKGTSEANLR